jgi:hypothetical protein
LISALLARLFGPRLADRLTPWMVLLALGAAAWWLAGLFHAHTELQTWLFWRYLAVWVCCALFAAACLSVGNWIVWRLSESEQRAPGHLTLSLSCGVFAFFALTAAVGFAHGFGPISFVLIPVSLFAVGARRLWQDLGALRRRLREEPAWFGLSPVEVAAFALGFVALLVIYLAVLVPDNASYDARWYHIAVAEHYAAAGGIVRSVEGNVTVTVPQLASVLSSWAFCMPFGGLFEHFELAAHLEFVLLLFTLPGVVAVVRYLVPGVRARAAWLAMFVFPSLFIYDSSLHGGADHVAALWTIPTYLSLIGAFKTFRLRACLLFALCVSGLLMSKYTAVSAVVGPLLVFASRGLYLGARQLLAVPRRAPALLNLLATLGAGLLFTSPHWLKNLIWHGDPIYPLLHRHLHVRPWNGDGDFLFAVYQEQQFVPTGTMQHKLLGMLHALWDHSYALYNWADFHGTYPVFGSLFTASMVALPFLRGTRRTWGLVALTHLGIIVWYWVSDAERYLQTLLPWMAAVVAALALLAWRSGWPARLGVVVLGGLQIVWGADMIFWPLHRMAGRSPVGLANDFFAKGYNSQGADRTKPFEEYAALGRALPKGSKVLVHHEHLHLGLGTMVVSDSTRMAYGINYGELGSPQAVDKLFKSYGITHVVWDPRVVYGDESVAGDLVFHTYAQTFETVVRHGSRTVAALPKSPPPPRNNLVLMFQCDGSYPAGIFELSDLRLSPYPLSHHRLRFPRPRQPIEALPDLPVPPSYAVVNDSCSGAPSMKGYRQIASAGTIRYFAAK